MDKKIKIAIMGLKGSYTHQVAQKVSKLIKKNFEIVEGENFNSLFENTKKFGLGLVPIENSLGGTVVECLDLFRKEKNLDVICEVDLNIKHVLLSKKKLK